MKKNKLYIASVAFAALSLVTSCDSFLDKLPDDRAEVNTEEKVTSLLVSAYPTASSNLILEWSSDNYADNGKQYSTNQEIEQVYRFQPITAQTNDCPKSLWRKRGKIRFNRSRAAKICRSSSLLSSCRSSK